MKSPSTSLVCVVASASSTQRLARRSKTKTPAARNHKSQPGARRVKNDDTRSVRSRGASRSLGASDLGALLFLLARHAQPRVRHDLEALPSDGIAARLAVAVDAAVETAQ